MTEQQHNDNNNDIVQQSIGRISRASSIGIVVWITGYIILSHCFISLKWDSTNQNPVLLSTSTVVLDTNNNDTIVVNPSLYSKEEIHTLKKQLRTTIDNTHNDINNIQSLYNSLRIVIEEYTFIQSKFYKEGIHRKQKQQTNKQSNAFKIPEQLKLKQLLNIGNIHNEVRSPNQFSKYISAAIHEIQTNILFHTSTSSSNNSSTSIDWTHYTTLFRNTTLLFPFKKIWYDNSDTKNIENESGSCSIPPGMLDGNKSTTTKKKLKLASENDFGILSQELLDTIVLPLKSEIHSITKSISNFKRNYATTTASSSIQQQESNTTSTTQEHLQQIIPTLLQSIPKSISKVQTSLHTIIESIVHDIKDIISIDDDDDDADAVVEEIDDVDDTIHNKTNFICLSNHDIHSWIHNGLDGFYRGYDDIRGRIIQSMIDDNVPDADTFILDADLSSSLLSNSNNNYNISANINFNNEHSIVQYNILQQIKKYNNRPKTVRQLLDIPAFYYTLSYLDPFIDTISGQNDILDDILEKIVWSQIPTSDITDTDTTDSKNEIRILPVISTNTNNNNNNNESPNIIAQTAIISLYRTIGNIPIPNWFWDVIDP